jgi:arylsulfatase A-like enzyme/GH35 family endo-1,4-beta-xylanase
MFIKKIILLAIVIFSVLQLHSQNTQKPNILFIAIDDLKPTIGAFDDTYAITPNLDSFSENATVFLNNHCQWAVCGPSRASLMTGKRPDATKVRDLKTRMRDVNPDILAIPEYFKQNGYATIGVGKIYDPRCVDKQIDGPSWSVPYYKESGLNFPKEYGSPVFGYYQNKEIKAKIAALIQEGKDKGVKNPQKYARDRYKPPYGASNAPDDAYMDGAIAKKGIDLIDELSKDPSKPFFLAVGFKRPHLPFVAPQKYWDLYDESKIPYAKFQQKAKNSPDIGYHSSNELRSYKDETIEYTLNNEDLLALDKETQKKLIHGYYAATSFVDVQVGRLLDELKAKGLDKNTIVIIWGDHGWHLGDHSMWNKHSNFEQSTRSPMMIMLPGSTKSIRVNSPTEFVDIFPTLCDLAGLEIPDNLDGLSLAPIVEGKTKKVKEYAVTQISRGKNMGYSFRTDGYRYTVWINNKFSTDKITSNDIFAQELYDYKNDPLETTDHFGESSYKKVQAEMIRYSEEYFKNEHEKTKKKTSNSTQINKSIKQLLKEGYDTNAVFIGVTLGREQLNTKIEKLFLKDFTYSTSRNFGKQSYIHRQPGEWRWDYLEKYLKFANKNNIDVRIHGPISPQASKWAKTDSRTASELETNMIEFMTALSIKLNNEKSVKWMDVVNETIERNGDWFKDKPGVDQWENPWVKMGYDKAGIPLYITKAFEIANTYAPNISQVFNQHGGMEPVMWEKVKKTILYLKEKGYRIDGLGWQAHLKETSRVVNDPENLIYLAELIDWAHANNLDFHITEIDYHIKAKKPTAEEYQEQANAYAKILKVVLEKRKSGIVTYNIWGLVDGDDGSHHQYIYDKNLKPKPVYFKIKETLIESSKQ